MITKDITTLLPQQPPYILVDCLVDISHTDATTLYRIREDSPFVREGKMRAAGLMENIAQTCAAHIGYYSDSIRIGVVGAVPTMEVFRLPRVGEILETSVTVTAEVFDMRAVEAVVCCAGTPVAKGTMKISLT